MLQLQTTVSIILFELAGKCFYFKICLCSKTIANTKQACLIRTVVI